MTALDAVPHHAMAAANYAALLKKGRGGDFLNYTRLLVNDPRREQACQVHFSFPIRCPR